MISTENIKNLILFISYYGWKWKETIITNGETILIVVF